MLYLHVELQAIGEEYSHGHEQLGRVTQPAAIGQIQRDAASHFVSKSDL